MALYFYVVLIALATQYSVHAGETLNADLETEDDAGKASLGKLNQLYHDYSQKESSLTAENKDECNTQKHAYADAFDGYVTAKGKAAGSVSKIMLKDEIVPLPYVAKDTDCVASTNYMAIWSAVQTKVTGAISNPTQAAKTLMESKQYQTLQANFEKIKASPQVQGYMTTSKEFLQTYSSKLQTLAPKGKPAGEGAPAAEEKKEEAAEVAVETPAA